MSDKPTGVFVRLPLSEAQKAAAYDLTSKSGATDAILAIGTPVTGGNLQPIGKVAGHFSDGQPMVRILNHPHLPYETEIALYNDAQVQIAALEAKVVRMREALSRISVAASNQYEATYSCLKFCINQAQEALKGGA